MRGGRSPYNVDDIAGVAWFTLDITASNNLRITRGANPAGATADVGWFVVSFACDCQTLTPPRAEGLVTVTAPSSFQMRFNQAAGGAIDQFYDLAEDPTRVNDLAGGLVSGRGLISNGLEIGGVHIFYNVDQNSQGAKLDVLEATGTRVRVRQEAFYQRDPNPPGTAILAGIKGFGDYSIYPAGRLALRWTQRTTSPITYTIQDLDLNIHQAAAPLDAWDILQPDRRDLHEPGDRRLLPAPEGGRGGEDRLPPRHVQGLDDSQRLRRPGRQNQRAPRRPQRVEELVLGGAGGDDPRGDRPLQPAAGRDLELPDLLQAHGLPGQRRCRGHLPQHRLPRAEPLTVSVGGSWPLASENTGASDDFNESEGAYALTLDPANRPDLPHRRQRGRAPLQAVLQDPAVALAGRAPVRDAAGYAARGGTGSTGGREARVAGPLRRTILSWHSTLESGGGGDGSRRRDAGARAPERPMWPRGTAAAAPSSTEHRRHHLPGRRT